MSDRATHREDVSKIWSLTFEQQPDYRDPLQVAEPMMAANLRLAAAGIRPLVAEATLLNIDDELGVHYRPAPRAGWRLAGESPVEPNVGRWPVPETLVQAKAIDREALESFFRTASDQASDEECTIAPVELSVVAVRAIVPAPWSGGAELPVDHDGGTSVVAIERDADSVWVTGPTDGILEPPVRTHAWTEAITTRVTITAMWSPWMEPGSAGTAAIEQVVSALEGDGWRRK